MAITDLTGYTWVGNDNIDFSSLSGDKNVFNIIFTVQNTQKAPFTTFKTWQEIYYGNSDLDENLVYNGGWGSALNKTIVINSGTDVTNTTFISWLESNGTLTAPTSDLLVSIKYNNVVFGMVSGKNINVSYNNQTLTTISEVGTKTLNVQGKLMQHNVVVGDKTLLTQGKLMQNNIVLETTQDQIFVLTANDEVVQDANENNIVVSG